MSMGTEYATTYDYGYRIGHYLSEFVLNKLLCKFMVTEYASIYDCVQNRPPFMSVYRIDH